MIITHNGQRYEITNWEEFRDKLLKAIGFQLEAAISEEINKLGIVDTGAFKASIRAEVVDGELIITSDAPHAEYLEYGTAGTKQGVSDPFGERNRGPNPGRKMPLRKVGDRFMLVESLESWARRHGFKPDAYFALAKRIQEKGLQPYAPFRRVLYNEQKMARIISRAVAAAGR